MSDQRQSVISLIQGEYRVSSRPDAVITTILGSCVAACLFDPHHGIGGMNHFLLPGADPRDRQNIKYGAYAMEQLINALLRKGAQRASLMAKVFGGAAVVRSLSDIGRNNADFALAFLKEEGIAVSAQCLGGTQGRRVRFWPHDGRAQVMLMQASDVDPALPREVPTRPVAPMAGEVDLF
ncbi:MAG: chemotaxis signal relay system protein CheD [Rhodobacteraceae bacterium HLUCCA12]|nr:MAG: chemotaxis signal relay system protein CheD [Rhodobacteraceae bacterium HLUCCA12]